MLPVATPLNAITGVLTEIVAGTVDGLSNEILLPPNSET